MSEIPLVDWPGMAFDIVIKIVIREFHDAREQGEQTFVHGAGEVVAKLGDLIHEGMDTGGNLVE